MTYLWLFIQSFTHFTTQIMRVYNNEIQFMFAEEIYLLIKLFLHMNELLCLIHNNLHLQWNLNVFLITFQFCTLSRLNTCTLYMYIEGILNYILRT